MLTDATFSATINPMEDGRSILELSRYRVRVMLLIVLSAIAVVQGDVSADSPKIRSGPITDADRQLWSFQPVVRPAIPRVNNAGWCRTPVDYFVLEKLHQRDLPTVDEANRRTLIRRATVDLTGLPPTPQAIRAFLADRAPGAYERLVERLLASPHYGERWGRHWLDVVRYADTAGETADFPVPLAWQYRNWVINAFNADRPYDAFIQEQIAGDILAQSESGDRFRELVKATGFLAISRRFGFGIKEHHYLTIQDTIDTLGQSVLGLSPGCARCHDHKYDPINMDDYYAWYGIFASTHYAWTADEKTKKEREFVPLIPFEEADQLDAEREPKIKELKALVETLKKRSTEIDKQVAAVGTDPLLGDLESFPIAGKLDDPFNSRVGVVSTEAQSPYTNVNPAGTRGLRTRNEAGNNGLGCKVPKATAETNRRVWINLDFRNVSAKAKAKGSSRIYVGQGPKFPQLNAAKPLTVPGQSPAVDAYLLDGRFFVNDGDAHEAVCEIEMGTWYNLQIELDLERRVYSGTIGTLDQQVTFSEKRVRRGWNGIVDEIFVDAYGPRMGVKPEQDFDNFTLRTEPLLPIGETVAGAGKPELDVPALRREQTEVVHELEVTQKRVKELTRPSYEVAFAAREGKPQDVAMQLRGNPKTPGDVVTRRHFAVFGGQAVSTSESSSGRMDLARWLTRTENPLTARVMVNRIWQHHFGRGLVETPNDFGVRGRPPSHPELLDWLADEFVRSGWSIKHMHRLLMTSRVYQLASALDSRSTLSEEDEHVRTGLFGRYPRRRLEAEAVRDAMLALGRQLDRSQGEGHPFPAPEAWRNYSQHGPFYAVYPSKQRSVYLMNQRLKSHPFLGLFDAADPSVSTGRRNETTTPTQALYLMNNEFVHEQSGTFADALLEIHSGDLPDVDARRVESAFEECFARLPREDETKSALAFLDRYRAGLADSGLDENDQQREAWAAFLRTLFVRNEFLFLR